MDNYKSLIKTLKKGRRFLVASHFNPDGDCIGSTLAMGLLLEHMGKEVVLYNRDPLPDNLAFLPKAKTISDKIPKDAEFDLAVMVDCAQRKRISDDFANCKNLGKVVCIDHHLMEKSEADIALIDSDAASTGEVVLRIARCAGLKLDADLATCIYTTLVVDTGFFKYSNTGADCLELAAELVRAGAVPWDVAKNIEESYPACRMKLLGLSLTSLCVGMGGKYATMDVTREMLARSGATMELSDEFAVFPRSIEGVEVSALFRELGDDKVKMSLRSKDHVDVAAIARAFGGGGHARAAGAQVKATMEEAKQRLRAAVEIALTK